MLKNNYCEKNLALIVVARLLSCCEAMKPRKASRKKKNMLLIKMKKKNFCVLIETDLIFL